MKIFDNHKLVIAFICITIIISIIWRVFIAEGQDETALILAQGLRAECGDCSKHSPEKAAIAHVYLKRARQLDWPLTKMIRVYSPVFRSNKSRAISIRCSTFKKPLDGKAEWWLEMEVWTRDFLDGRIADPLPAAKHFSEPKLYYRAKRANWKVVAKYSNWFYTF